MKNIAISLLLVCTSFLAVKSQTKAFVELKPKLNYNYNTGVSMGTYSGSYLYFDEPDDKLFNSFSTDVKGGVSFDISKNLDFVVAVGIFNVKTKYEPSFLQSSDKYKAITNNITFGIVNLGLDYTVFSINDKSDLSIYGGIGVLSNIFMQRYDKSPWYAKTKDNKIDSNTRIVYRSHYTNNRSINVMLEFGVNYNLKINRHFGLQAGFKGGQCFRSLQNGVAYFEELDEVTKQFKNSVGKSIAMNIGQYLGANIQLAYCFDKKRKKA